MIASVLPSNDQLLIEYYIKTYINLDTKTKADKILDRKVRERSFDKFFQVPEKKEDENGGNWMHVFKKCPL